MIDYRGYPPQLAKLAGAPFDSDQWIYEVKHDGERVLAFRDGAELQLRSRSGRDVTAQFPDVVGSCLALPLNRYVLDCEAVVLNQKGVAEFSLIQQRGMANPPPAALRSHPVILMAFDILRMNDIDTRGYALTDRKIVLQALLKIANVSAIRPVEHVAALGRQLYALAEQSGWEGVVAKRAASTYTGTRSNDWLKFKCRRRGSFVVIGWTDPQNSREHFGALAVAERDSRGQLRYVGKCGTGYTDQHLAEIAALLKLTDQPACETGERDIHYCAPTLTIECEFLDRTCTGQLRHASFKGLRPALILVK